MDGNQPQTALGRALESMDVWQRIDGLERRLEVTRGLAERGYASRRDIRVIVESYECEAAAILDGPHDGAQRSLLRRIMADAALLEAEASASKSP